MYKLSNCSGRSVILNVIIWLSILGCYNSDDQNSQYSSTPNIEYGFKNNQLDMSQYYGDTLFNYYLLLPLDATIDSDSLAHSGNIKLNDKDSIYYLEGLISKSLVKLNDNDSSCIYIESDTVISGEEIWIKGLFINLKDNTAYIAMGRVKPSFTFLEGYMGGIVLDFESTSNFLFVKTMYDELRRTSN